MEIGFTTAGIIAAYVFLFLFVLVIAKLINEWVTPYNIDEQLVKQDNLALSVSFAGYFCAVVTVFIGAITGPETNFVNDLIMVGTYSFAGIILLNVSRIINDKLILYRFKNVKEIIDDQNTGTGAVQFGSYLASGFIIAGAIHGEGGGPITALTFFALGQLVLIIFGRVYSLITPYDFHDEIEKDNVAAGVAFGGGLTAIGIVLMKAVSGNFVSWSYNLGIFLVNTVVVIALLPLIRIFFDKIILPGAKLDDEIVEDQNIGAAVLESVTLIIFACSLFFIMA